MILSLARDVARGMKNGRIKDVNDFLQRWRAGDETLNCLFRPIYLVEEVSKAIYGADMGNADEEEVYRQIGLLIQESLEKLDAQEQAANALSLDRANYQVQETRDVGNLLAVPGTEKWEGVRHGVEVVDRVHTISDVTLRIGAPTETLQLEVKQTMSQTRGGQYTARGSQAVAIAINLEGGPDDDAETTLHEIGHMIDHLALSGGTYGSEDAWIGRTRTVATSSGEVPTQLRQRQEDVRALMQEIRDSATYQAVRAFPTGPYRVTQPGGDAVEYYHPPSTARTVRQPCELFARAYSEWVTLRSGDERLRGELDRGLERQQRGGVPYAWPLTDFEPIGQAFDRLFGRQGWLRSD